MSDSKFHDLTGLNRTIEQLALSASEQSPYRRGGSGGGDGTMERLAIVETKLTAVESRMDRLEVRMDGVEGRLEKVDDRLRGVEVGLATLAERVAHLPSKGFIVSATLTTLLAVAAFSVFGENIRALLGL